MELSHSWHLLQGDDGEKSGASLFASGLRGEERQTSKTGNEKSQHTADSPLFHGPGPGRCAESREAVLHRIIRTLNQASSKKPLMLWQMDGSITVAGLVGQGFQFISCLTESGQTKVFFHADDPPH